MRIELNRIKIKQNTRLHYEGLETLMHSIREKGLMNAINVRRANNSSGDYILIAGHRRYLACKKLGHKRIQVKVENPGSNIESMLLTIAENLDRNDITPYELGMSFKTLIDFGLTPSEIAARVGRSHKFVKDLLRVCHDIGADNAKKLSFGDNTKGSKHGLTPQKANDIITIGKNHRLTKSQTSELLSTVHRQELSKKHITHISKLIKGGCDVGNAIKNAEKYNYVKLEIPILKSRYDKLKKIHGSIKKFGELAVKEAMRKEFGRA